MQKHLAAGIVGRVGWAGLEAIVSALVSLAALLGIARLIGASEFGLGALALGVVWIVFVVPQCLFQDALVRNPQASRRHFDSAWTATLLLSLLAVLICIALTAPLAAFFREPRFSAVFLSFSIALIPHAVTAPLIAERRREMDFRLVAIDRVIATSVGTAVGAGCALAGLGVWSLVAQQGVSGVLGLMIMLIYSPLKPRFKLAIRDLKPMVRFGSSIVGTQFLVDLGPGLFMIYIGRIGDLTLAGYWGLANRIVEVFRVIFTQAAYQLALAHFARIQEQPSLLGRVVRGANVCLSIIALPGLILIIVIGPDIIKFLLGEAWLPAAPAAQILAVGVMIRLRRLMDQVALNALGNSEVALWAHLLEAAVSTAALFLLAPKALAWIALLKAIQPIIGYLVIAVRSIEMTGRSAARECWDLSLDLILVAVISLIIWYLHLFLIDESLLLVLVASPVVAIIAAAFMMMVLRPAAALDAWSVLRPRSDVS
jgi:O-antigen/teichoic acid export membrane protein